MRGLCIGVGRRQVAGLRPRYPHAARVLRIEADHGYAVGDCAADDLSRAADAGRILAVPNGDQKIDIREHDEAGGLVGTRTLASVTVQFENRGGVPEQSFERSKRFRRMEIAGIFGAGKRQHGFQHVAARKPRFCDQAIRAFSQR